LAVNADAVARPDALVTAVVEFVPPGTVNVPLAPEPGAWKVTVTPLTGFPPASVTFATKDDAKAVPMAALCPDPLFTATVAAEPTTFVREKVVEMDVLAMVAVTV
jgi:hypothetical protein